MSNLTAPRGFLEREKMKKVLHLNELIQHLQKVQKDLDDKGIANASVRFTYWEGDTQIGRRMHGMDVQVNDNSTAADVTLY